jgi:hypothetical protein
MFCSCFIALFLVCVMGMAKEKLGIHPDQISDVSLCFLKTWLIDRNIDSTLEYLSNNPVMGACMGDPKENLGWRFTRVGVIAKLKPALPRIASDSPKNARLADAISGQETKLDYARIKHRDSDLFDLYPVGPDLFRVIEKGICSGEERWDQLSHCYGILIVKSDHDLSAILF